LKQIGSGAYGVVASALNRQTNKKVAIKKVKAFIFRSLMPLTI
jgi:serine/threonine protein kinase